VVAAAAAVRAHATTHAQMVPLVRHQLQPVQPQQLLMRRACALLAKSGGDANSAEGLLRAALRHADARRDIATRAECLLHLAQIASLAGTPQRALILAQAAQQSTQDTRVWLAAVLLYSQQRCAAAAVA
jgi:hypothetical protein